MRVTIKTLQQVQFPVDINVDETVLQLKEKISQMAESKGVAVERQKLIHAGKVLDDTLTLLETAVKEGDFIVLMIITPKQPTSRSLASGASSTTSASTFASAAQKEPSKKSTEPQAKEAESRLVTGDAYEEAIGRLVDMGFDRESVVAAMRASFNNPERAVEYLTSGTIPETEEDTIAGGERPATSDTTRNSGVLEFLRNDPQFQQLRILIQQNPQMLGPIIEQLSQSSPEMIHLIEQNREEFLALITEGANPEELGISLGMTGEEDDDGDGEGEEDIEGDAALASLPPAAQVLQVTEEERQAIERLESMGFERARVVEAFFACDKNEELAANYLLEHLNDD